MELAYDIAKSFQNYPEVAFLWIGDGQDKQQLEELALKEKLSNIIFTGFSDNVAHYLSWTNIYLSTSRWEGLPYALMEAGSLGIPIVASDVVGNSEIVKTGINGFLFDLQKPEQAVDYIKLLINDKPKYAAMSAASHQTFREMFQIEVMIAKLGYVYKNPSNL
jgi:glycosyltransferase involved in cell wall biosynthesis